MIQSIKKPKFSEVLPPSILRDENLLAIAKSLDRELEKLSADAQKVLHLPRLDELPHEILDLLAWQFHVDFYEPTEMDIETKRKLIRESLLWHRIKGTPVAVEKLLQSVMRDAQVEEWFEYGGRPYYFRIKAAGLKFYGDEGETFFRMIDATKNIRSWLDDIDFDMTVGGIDTSITLPNAIIFGGDEYFDLADPADTTPPQKIFTGITELSVESEKVDLDFSNLDDNFGKIFIGSIELQAGYTVVDAEYIPDINESGDLIQILRQKWQRFKDNPVIQYYHHHNHDFDGELENPTDEETFPYDKDFLRLYFSFEDTRTRYITLFNPKKDISAEDINYLGNYAAEYRTLLNSRNLPTTGIKRALFITKTTEKVF